MGGGRSRRRPSKCHSGQLYRYVRQHFLSMVMALRCFDVTVRMGLLNLGQTCFLNVILQSFFANPLLRNYFLSDMHNHKTCKLKECMCCELDRLFVEVSCRRNQEYATC